MTYRIQPCHNCGKDEWVDTPKLRRYVCTCGATLVKVDKNLFQPDKSVQDFLNQMYKGKRK